MNEISFIDIYNDKGYYPSPILMYDKYPLFMGMLCMNDVVSEYELMDVINKNRKEIATTIFKLNNLATDKDKLNSLEFKNNLIQSLNDIIKNNKRYCAIIYATKSWCYSLECRFVGREDLSNMDISELVNIDNIDYINIYIHKDINIIKVFSFNILDEFVTNFI